MNDRVVAWLRSGGVQLELMVLAWRRTSPSVLANGVLPLSTKFLDQSGPSHSISSGLAFAVAVVACIVCRPRGQRFSSRPVPNRITAKSHVSAGFVYTQRTTSLPREGKSHVVCSNEPRDGVRSRG